MSQKKYKMFVAGPVNVHDEVKDSMNYGEIGHRETEFSDLFKNIKQNFHFAFGTESKKEDYDFVVIGGSGTSATETLLSSVLHDDKKTLVIANGAFGERINEICELHKVPTILLNYGWGNYPNLEEIEQRMQNNEIEAVTAVLMETSTGMLNPIKKIGELCKKYEKTFIVDAVSALAGEPLNMVEDNIDYCITNTNKTLEGLPVLGIIGYKKLTIEKSKDVKPKSYYLDFFKHVKYAEHDQTPFTPQIPLFYMLDKALERLKEEGVQNRISRYKRNGDLLKKTLYEIGFKPQLKENEMSNLMINVLTPKNWTYEEFHDKLKERGYIFYPGKGELDGKVIHLANIGTLTEEDVIDFCNDIKDVIKERPIEY